MPINWDLVTPAVQPNPAGEVASMTELLGLIGERRAKDAQVKHAQDLAERQYLLNKRNLEEDNKRQREQMEANRQYQKDQLEQAKNLKLMEVGEGWQKQAREALPKIEEYAAGNQPGKMRDLATASRIGVEDVHTPAQEDVLGPLREGMPGMPALIPQSSIPERNAYRFTLPAMPPGLPPALMPTSSSVLEYDPQEPDRARAIQAQKTREELAKMGTSGVPYAQEAASVASAVAPLQKTEEEGGKTFLTERQRLADEAARKDRAEIMATGKASSEAHKTRVANTTAWGKVKTDVDSFLRNERFKENTKDYDEAGKALRLIDSTAPGQRAAMDNFIKNARGGMATGQFLAYMSKNMAGVWGGLLDKMESYNSGKLGAPSKEALRAAIVDTLEATKHEAIEPTREAFSQNFFTPEYYPFKTNLEAKYKSLFGRYGYKLKSDPAAQGMTPTGEVLRRQPPAAPVAARAATPAAPGQPAMSEADRVLNDQMLQLQQQLQIERQRAKERRGGQ